MYLTNLYYALQLIVLWVGGVVAAEAQAGEEWHLEKDKNGIQVYSRHLDGSRLKEIKVHCEMMGHPAQLVAFFSDVDHYSQVVYKTRTARLLRRVSESELYYYAESEMPWPATNRDFVVHLRFGYEPKTGTLQINTNAVPDMVPPQTGLVRLPFWQAVWFVRPMSENKMQIDYQFQVDPGGKLPVWLINMTAAIGPYQSFLNLREKTQLPRYQGRSFGFMTVAN